MKNIAIIGAGQLGSRHLQALANVNEDVILYIVDPIEKSLRISTERFNEVNTLGTKLVCLNQITDLPKELEFVVISTNSKQRLSVLKELLNQAEVKYLLLEKFLFPTVQEYEEANLIIESVNTLVFVNCARKMWPFYQNLKSIIDTSSKVTFKVAGVNWNLASNSIHFLNLYLYLLNETKAVIDTSLLDHEVLENKRAGYIELSGTLKAITPNEHELILTSRLIGDEPLLISINSVNQSIIIDEANQVISINGEMKTFTMHHQSSLTNKVYEQLQESGSCSLVSYKQSVEEHLLLLRAFNVFLGEKESAIT